MNPYTTLGLTATASQDEIKKAYRKIAKKVHPDLNPGNKDAEKKIQRSFYCLRDSWRSR